MIPTFIAKQRDIKTVYALKKQYTIYNNIYNAIAQSQGAYKYWGLSSVKDKNEIQMVTEKFLPYLNHEKMCISETGCWAKEKIKALNGKIDTKWQFIEGGIGDNFTAYKMKDGTIINMDIFDNKDMINRFGVKCDSPYNLSIYIDLNGNDKPNIIGRDIFVLTLTDRGLLPAGTDNTTNCTTKDETEFAGLQCASKVLQEEKINY